MATRSGEATPRLVRKGSLTESAASAICALISDRKLKPGDRLPSQRELATDLGVSCTLLREAIRELILMRVLSVHHGSGTFVDAGVTAAMAERFTSVMAFQENDVLEILEARIVIERESAKLAAQRAGEDELQCLGELITEMNEWRADPGKTDLLDVQFHSAIARMSKNRVLSNMFDTIRGSLTLQIRQAQQLPGVAQQALRYHQRIYEAIRSRNPGEAGKLMAEHLRKVESIIRDACRTAAPRGTDMEMHVEPSQ